MFHKLNTACITLLQQCYPQILTRQNIHMKSETISLVESETSGTEDLGI